jgi:arylsulfatase A-like enzyme
MGAQQPPTPAPTTPLPPVRHPNQPNIIFILADDLGYGDLGCYGQKKIRTPNLDRLAAEGMRFTQCYAGSTVCAPSRSVLMTGLHTGHTRIRGNAKRALLEEDLTVAEVLQAAGYRTGAIGKWGLGVEGTSGHPNRQGFKEWFGFLDQTHAHNYYPDYLWRNSRRRELPANAGGAKGLYVQDLFTMTATNFARIHYLDPFFLYLAYTIPHANNELKNQGMEVPSDAPYSQESWPEPERNKAAMITRLDSDVGLLLDRLRELNMESNTVIFFSSDNGPHREGGNDPAFFKSSGGLRGIKRDLYEGGIRVPMIVRWPGRVAAGKVSDFVWGFQDFLPTAAEIAGANPPRRIDGLSILPHLLGQKQTNRHEFLYWEFHEKGFAQAVRMGDWKAVKHPGKPLELYDLKADLAEERDVSGAQPEVVERIEAYLTTARTESEWWPVKEPQGDAAGPAPSPPQPPARP